MRPNLLHIYTGDGKGKTTQAMGCALRMLGHGHQVLIAQFLKDGTSGEIRALRHFPNAQIATGFEMTGFAGAMDDEALKALHHQIKTALDALKLQIASLKPRLLVLDELSVAIALRLLSSKEALEVIHLGLEHGDIIATGRYAPEELKEQAGYVCIVSSEKHPFEEGFPAQEGIEY